MVGRAGYRLDLPQSGFRDRYVAAVGAAVEAVPEAGHGFALHGWLLALWFFTSFVVVFFARDLQMQLAFPLNYVWEI